MIVSTLVVTLSMYGHAWDALSRSVDYQSSFEAVILLFLFTEKVSLKFEQCVTFKFVVKLNKNKQHNNLIFRL